MEFLKADLVGLIQYLLPGFVTLWVFYGLTAKPTTTPFERVVEALIYTGMNRVVIFLIHLLFVNVGKWGSLRLGSWTTEVDFAWSVLFALLFGVVFGGLAKSDMLHSWLRDWKFTNRTSHPTEWFTALNSDTQNRWVLIHMKAEKEGQPGLRIRGWAAVWPDHPDSGHFQLVDPSWVDAENNVVEMPNTTSILVPAASIKFVEFLKN